MVDTGAPVENKLLDTPDAPVIIIKSPMRRAATALLLRKQTVLRYFPLAKGGILADDMIFRQPGRRSGRKNCKNIDIRKNRKREGDNARKKTLGGMYKRAIAGVVGSAYNRRPLLRG